MSTNITLPEFTEARARVVEQRVMDDISLPSSTRARPWRGRIVVAGVGVAAALVLGALIVPQIIDDQNRGDAVATSGFDSTGGGGIASDMSDAGAAVSEAESAVGDESATERRIDGREIIQTGSVTVRVDNPATVAETLSSQAEASGGYLESQWSSGVESAASTALTFRVPAVHLSELVAAASSTGTVVESFVDRVDVTQQGVDLDARIDALRISVDRLQQLLAEAASVDETLSVEEALATRQAELESLTQQRESLTDQVTMATLSVTLEQLQQRVEPDAADFGSGLTTGLNALASFAGGLLVSAGFIVPWLIPIALVTAAVWGVIRLRRRRRGIRNTPDLLTDGDENRP